jgi:hypothetical protein
LVTTALKEDMKTTPALLILAAAAAIPVAAGAAKPPSNSTVTAIAAPSVVTFGTPAKVSGTTAPTTAVTLQADAFPYDGNFSKVASSTSDASGAYAFPVTPADGTHYRVTAKLSPPVTSPIVALGVRWHITLKVSTRSPSAGSKVRFSGTVAPGHTGQPVRVQKRTASGFRTVAGTTLTAGLNNTSVYSIRVRVKRSGTYRVQVASDGSRQAATSSKRRLTVR